MSRPTTRPMSGTVGARTAGGNRWRRMLPPALVAGALATATVALHLRDPHVEGSWGECPTKALFGIDCPGCGGLRAVNDLTNLQVVDAASSNAVFVLALPVIAYVFVRWSLGRWRAQPWDPSDRAMTWSAMSLIAVLTVFTVLRNLPAGAWLAA